MSAPRPRDPAHRLVGRWDPPSAGASFSGAHEPFTSRRERRTTQPGGQALLVFALVSTLLFGVVGVAVDSGMGYLAAASVERAAAAGATAGVVYMPGDFSQATQIALTAAGQNGFVNDDATGGRNVAVTVTRSPAGCGGGIACATNRLSVTVSEMVGTTFIRALGFGSHRVSSTKTSEYLRPIGLGQPGPQLGADDKTFGDGSSSNFFMLEQEGWAVPRHNGDAFSPNPTSDFSSDPTKVDLHALSRQLGTDTITQPLRRGGYNYFIFVPAGQSIQARVFNPTFAPTDNYIPADAGLSAQAVDEGHFMTKTGSPPSGYTTDSREYAQMAYSVFRVAGLNARQLDTPLSRMVVKPIDAFNAPAGYRDVYTGTAVAGMPYAFHNWLDVTAADPNGSDASLVAFTPAVAGGGGLLTGGANGSNYRLRVDSLDSTGADPDLGGSPTDAALHMKSAKFYSVQAWDTTAGALCGGCTVSAVNDMAFQVRLQGSAATTISDVPLMQIPKEYAGKTISVNLFDPGDLALPVTPPPSARIPTYIDQQVDGGVTTVTKDTAFTILSKVEWKPPPNTGWQTFPCPAPGGPGERRPLLTYYDGPPSNNVVLSDRWGGTTEDPCNGLEWPGSIWFQNDSLAVGTHTIYAVFAGNSVLLPSTASTVVTVIPPAGPYTCNPNPIVPYYQTLWDANDTNTGHNVVFWLVFASSAGQPQGKATLIDVTAAGDKVVRGPDYIGSPSTGWWNVDNREIAPGAHQFRIDYTGYGPYPACSVTFNGTVAGAAPAATSAPPSPPLPTTTTLAASANPMQAGDTVVLTAGIGQAGGSVNQGNVRFCLDDAACGAPSVLCAGVAVGAGIAMCSTAGLTSAGNHTIYALYSGSATSLASAGWASETVVTAPSGGGGGGGTAYHGGGVKGATLPLYRPGRFASTMPLAAPNESIELQILQPDRTIASAVKVVDLGPAERGTMPCPDFGSGCPVAASYQDGAGTAAFFTNDSTAGNIFNGKWLQIVIRIPADYDPAANAYWTLRYITPPNVIPEDTLTLVAGFHGSPVHIVG